MQKSLTIAVNCRMLLSDRLDGIGWFAYQTLKRITQDHPEVSFIFLFDRPYSQDFIFSSNVTPMIVTPPAGHPLLYYVWFQIKIKALLKKLKPDLFLSPDGLLSLGASVKQLAVIHDINFKHYPNDLPFFYRNFFNRYFPKYAREATRIATVSEFTKQDLITEYSADASKIDVVYNGVDEGYAPLAPTEAAHVRRQFTGGKDYFLFVGSIHPRKNIIRLLEAFELFKEASNSDMKLVIAGSLFWSKLKIMSALKSMHYKKDVILLGRTKDKTLKDLMGSAFALTYIPYFEGFGVPLLEAMRSKVPILCSNVTALPEIVGKAALLVDPFDIIVIKNAMLKIYSDGELRSKLVEQGTARVQNFSWEKTADKLWESIKKTLNA